MIAIRGSHRCKAIQLVPFYPAPLRLANQVYEAVAWSHGFRQKNQRKFVLQIAAASAGACSRYKNARFDSFMDVLRTFLSEAGLERREPWRGGMVHDRLNTKKSQLQWKRERFSYVICHVMSFRFRYFLVSFSNNQHDSNMKKGSKLECHFFLLFAENSSRGRVALAGCWDTRIIGNH